MGVCHGCIQVAAMQHHMPWSQRKTISNMHMCASSSQGAAKLPATHEWVACHIRHIGCDGVAVLHAAAHTPLRDNKL